VFYPREGSVIDLTLRRSLYQRSSFRFIESDIPDIIGAETGFTQLYFNFEKRLKLSKKITGILETGVGHTRPDDSSPDFYSLSFPRLFYMGGNIPIARYNTTPFEGLQEDEIISSQFIMLKLGSQINFLNSFYLTPHINTAIVGFSDIEDFYDNIFSASGNWQNGVDTSYLFSVGTTLSYNSFLGPIDLNVTYINDINQLRIFFSVGIPFFRG
jgi:NTE family protein